MKAVRILSRLALLLLAATLLVGLTAIHGRSGAASIAKPALSGQASRSALGAPRQACFWTGRCGYRVGNLRRGRTNLWTAALPVAAQRRKADLVGPDPRTPTPPSPRSGSWPPHSVIDPAYRRTGSVTVARLPRFRTAAVQVMSVDQSCQVPSCLMSSRAGTRPTTKHPLAEERCARRQLSCARNVNRAGAAKPSVRVDALRLGTTMDPPNPRLRNWPHWCALRPWRTDQQKD